MPELPETETIARDLHEATVHARIDDITVHRDDVLRETDQSSLHKSVVGLRIQGVWRRAKLIVFDLANDDRAPANDDRPRAPDIRTPSTDVRDLANDGRTPADDASPRAPDIRTPSSAATTVTHIVVQPRFTGAVLIDDGTLPTGLLDYLTVSFALDDGRSLHYRDVRRLGTLSVMSPQRFHNYSAGLGPEPLDAEFTIKEFSALVRASRRTVKALLMAQARLAGVGNIYANEALWHAEIDPSRIAATLSPAESVRLFHELRTVLRASIEARGTSFRDYRDARGERGGFVAQLAVYGRGGQPCLRCGRKLVDTHAIDGRTTVLCAHCQR